MTRLNPQEAKGWLSEMSILIDQSCCWSIEEEKPTVKELSWSVAKIAAALLAVLGCYGIAVLWMIALEGN